MATLKQAASAGPQKANPLSSLGRLIAATDVFPMRAIYAGIYRAGVEAFIARVRPLPGLQGLYLTGSYLRGDHVHGRSQVDYFVVVEPQHDPVALKRALELASALFPFLGLCEICVTDQQGQVDNPYLLYRQRAGLLHPLFERPGFELQGPAPNGALWVAEACLQIRLAVEGIRSHRDDLYFWRNRLRALQEILAATGIRYQLPPLGLHRPSQQLVGEMVGRERCLQAMLELLNKLDAPKGQLGLLPPNIPTGKGVTVLPAVNHQTLQAPGPWSVRLGGFQVSFAGTRREPGDLFLWRPLSLLGFGEPILVTSRLERRGGPLWPWTLEQARRTLACVPQLLEDPGVLESDRALLHLILALCVLVSLPKVAHSRADVIVQLALDHPDHQPFLTELVTYLTALEEGQGQAGSRQLPSNFFGYLRAFAHHQLGAPMHADLHRKLTLSVCVVTGQGLNPTLQAQSRQPDELITIDADDSALRNRALQESTGEIIVCIDDDCLLDPDWLAHLERSFLRHPRIGAVRGRDRRHFGLRRQLFDELGGYDPALPGGEGLDLCARIPRDRWQIFDCPHMVSRPRRGLLRQAWRDGMTFPRVDQKHHSDLLEVNLSWGPGAPVRLLKRAGMPFRACLFVHPFHVMHLMLALWLLSGNPLLGLLALVSLLLYLRADRSWQGYLLNLVWTLAHLVGGVRCGSLYLPDPGGRRPEWR